MANAEAADILTDGKSIKEDLAAVGQALAQGWEIPESLRALLPNRLTLVALGIDKQGQPATYSQRDRNRAVELLLRMVAQNAGLRGGSPPRGGAGQPSGAQPAARDGDPPWIVGSLDEVARFFARSRETIKDWRERGMPGDRGRPGRPGRYDLAAILAWRDQTIGSSGRNDAGDASRAEADRRRAVAEADRAALRVAQLKGRLVDVGDVARQFSHAATHIREQIDQLPDRLAALLPASIEGTDQTRIRNEARRTVDALIQALHEGLLLPANESSVSSVPYCSPS